MSRNSPLARGLAPREQQIMDVLHRLGTASVTDVREALADPPSYSAVRTMIGQLERKGFVRRDRSEAKHRYSAVQSRKNASRSALKRLISTFFPDSPGDAVAALIDDTAGKLSDDDLNRIQQAIERARQGDR
jgi:predicted transcriptional regulator